MRVHLCHSSHLAHNSPSSHAARSPSSPVPTCPLHMARCGAVCVALWCGSKQKVVVDSVGVTCHTSAQLSCRQRAGWLARQKWRPRPHRARAHNTVTANTHTRIHTQTFNDDSNVDTACAFPSKRRNRCRSRETILDSRAGRATACDVVMEGLPGGSVSVALQPSHRHRSPSLNEQATVANGSLHRCTVAGTVCKYVMFRTGDTVV